MQRNKKQIYPSTKANNFRAIHHIRDGNRIMKLELIKNRKMAAKFITLCRVSAMLNAHTLIRRKLINKIIMILVFYVMITLKIISHIGQRNV